MGAPWPGAHLYIYASAVPVLSAARLSAGGEGYYLEQIAGGREEYYTGAGEAPGVWVGAACPELGLEGEVQPDHLRRVLRALHPETGEELMDQIHVASSKRVSGHDLTLSAPKSVSLLYGLCDEDVSGIVRRVHDDAVLDAVRYLERHAAFARRGAGGTRVIDTSGFVAASFRHRTSRNGDPHLHTHVLVANLVHASDGRWSSLYATPTFYQGKAAGFVYQASLRARLVEQLGLSFERPENGCAEVAGIPRSLLKAFSTRRAEIEARLADLGATSHRARELATLETRRAKEAPAEGVESLRQAWRRRAGELGVEVDVLGSLIGDPRPVTIGEHGSELLVKMLLGRDGLTGSDSVFERRHVVMRIAGELRDGARPADIEQLVERLLARDEIARLGARGRGGGELMSTRELLEIEARLVERSVSSVGAAAGLVDAETVDLVLAERPAMAEEQRLMVRSLTGSGDGVQVVIGKAGAGKTYSLDAARAAWQRAGFTVHGAALAARAAAELESGSGIASSTLARLERALVEGEMSLGHRDVLVVDEAGMVGSRQLQSVVLFARLGGAKVVLVGDHLQLPAVEAGGVLAHLAERLGAVELSANRRQLEGWERQALDELRQGDVASALAVYDTHGRVHLCDSARTARLSMVQSWANARTGDGGVQMYAVRRCDVDDLNLLAREELRARGQLTTEDVWVADRPFAAGDEVVFTRNDRRLGVLNGTRGVVKEARPDGLVVETDKGTKLVGAGLVEEGRLSLGYCITVHKSQGQTVDRAFVLGGDALYREAGYVAMSRARERTDLYVVTSAFDEGLGDCRAHKEVSRSVWTRAMMTSRAKIMALEHLRGGHGERTDEQSRDPGAEMAREQAERIGRLLLGERAAVERPADVIAELGEPPELRWKRSLWVRAAGAVEWMRLHLGRAEESGLRLGGPGRDGAEREDPVIEIVRRLEPNWLVADGQDRPGRRLEGPGRSR